jgi:carbon monoxide dehydrogenase subunit G
MDLKGEYRIHSSREYVWELINNPDVLRQCIPGCTALEGNPENGFDATVTTKIGPVKANFSGSVQLTNINAPESYTISGEGQGGVAGFAKGYADVFLKQDGSEVILTYQAEAQVGGKLAQLGSRLIASTSKKLADEFFSKLTDYINHSAGAEPEIAPQPHEAAIDSNPVHVNFVQPNTKRRGRYIFCGLLVVAAITTLIAKYA